MARTRLYGPVGGEREREPADERGAGAQAERPKPEEGEAAGAEVPEQHEQVPRDHGPEQRLQGAEDGGERPAGEVDARVRLRLEAVRVEPRLRAAPELVAGQPELPGDLQVVPRGRRAGPAVEPLGEEVRPCVLQRRPGRDEACGEEERYDDCDKARAAASSSSTSGTSPSS